MDSVVEDLCDGVALVLALIEQESGGNEHAISKAGAVGLMQVLPSTAAELKLNPDDVSQNVRAGCLYLIRQLKIFNSLPLALAAYNAGPGRIFSIMRQHQVHKWSEVSLYVPQETRAYVPSVLSKMARLSQVESHDGT